MKKIFYILIALLIADMSLHAESKVSAGISAGYQYDTGRLAERNGINADVQQNVSIGAAFKFDMSFLFFRSGVEYSYPIEKGKVSDGSAGALTETSLSFYEVPVFGGLNIPLRDYGSFYIGGGGAYIFGTGSVRTTSGNTGINEQLFGWGFLAGVESEIYSGASLFMELEYVAARTSPVVSASGTYDDFYADYSGHRFRFGVLYHFNRYQ